MFEPFSIPPGRNTNSNYSRVADGDVNLVADGENGEEIQSSLYRVLNLYVSIIIQFRCCRECSKFSISHHVEHPLNERNCSSVHHHTPDEDLTGDAGGVSPSIILILLRRCY